MSRIFVRSELDAPFYILLLVEMSRIFVQSKLQALFYILWSSKRAPVPLTFKEAKGKLISGTLGVEPLSLALKTGLYTS